MPIYEYSCEKCGGFSSHLVMHPSSFMPHCNHCGSPAVKKLISRVHVRLSEETRLDRLADPSMAAGLDENDPKSMAKWMKKMGGLVGDDVGEDFDQMVDEAMEEAAGDSGPGGYPLPHCDSGSSEPADATGDDL